MRSRITLLIIVAVAGGVSLCGCDSHTVLRSNASDENARAEIQATSLSGLSCSIELVSGSDGGALCAKGNGWVCLRWENPEKAAKTAPTAVFFGKGGSETLSPAYQRPSDYPYYAGFGLVQCKYEFINAEGRVVKEGELGPPDEPLELGAGRMKMMWRPITAPDEAGKYSLQISVSQDRLMAALSSHNFVAAVDKNAGTLELCVELDVLDRSGRLAK